MECHSLGQRERELADVLQLLFIHPEIVAHFMDHGHADLLAEFFLGGTAVSKSTPRNLTQFRQKACGTARHCRLSAYSPRALRCSSHVTLCWWIALPL